ncbi:MAG: glycosyltransferase family 2 protein [Candidatus Omnitrophica bacterium]|nr:glycosyltransferase family 2 protein [Candidatus Omnitrophota bacterium]
MSNLETTIDLESNKPESGRTVKTEKLSVIIPIYNEAAHIKSVLDSVREVVLPNFVGKEVIVVDDSSTDDTAEILAAYKKTSGIKIVHHEKNKGKTAAVLRGIQESTGTIIVLQDGDLEYKPAEYPKLIDPILSGRAKVVFGSRWLGSIKKMKLLNRIANRISTITVNLLLGAQLTDVFCCHKAFRREVLNGIEITSKNFAFDSELTVKLLSLGYRIEEVPIDYTARSKSDGKKMNWHFALQMYNGLIRYKFIKNNKQAPTSRWRLTT